MDEQIIYPIQVYYVLINSEFPIDHIHMMTKKRYVKFKPHPLNLIPSIVDLMMSCPKISPRARHVNPYISLQQSLTLFFHDYICYLKLKMQYVKTIIWIIFEIYYVTRYDFIDWEQTYLQSSPICVIQC